MFPGLGGGLSAAPGQTAPAASTQPAKLYVGGIPAGTTESKALEAFSGYGTVTEIFLRSDANNPSQMWAFVTFASEVAASMALSMCNGNPLYPGAEHNLSVTWARSPAAETSPGGAADGALALVASSPAAMPGACPQFPFQAAGDEATPASASRASHFAAAAPQRGPTKLFVGSIPSSTTQQMITDEFSKFGPVVEVFLKTDTVDLGRSWGFVNFANAESATMAVAAFNDKYIFPNALRPLSVSIARNSERSVTPSTSAMDHTSLSLAMAAASPAPVGDSQVAGPTKLFVGSVPAGTTREALQAEFEKLGPVSDVFLKIDASDSNRMWGFVTYMNPASAAAAVNNWNERLMMPGGTRALAVSFARNSQAQHSMAAAGLAQAGATPGTKLFLGSVPIGTTEDLVRREFERFGQVTEVMLRNDKSDPTRMWGFLSFADPTSAAVAVSSLHEKLMLPGSVRPLAVSFAKSSPRPMAQMQGIPAAVGGVPHAAAMPAALPPSLTIGSWTVYYTAQGQPYYNNAATGVTQWERPPEFDAVGDMMPVTGQDVPGAARSAPY